LVLAVTFVNEGIMSLVRTAPGYSAHMSYGIGIPSESTVCYCWQEVSFLWKLMYVKDCWKIQFLEEWF